MPDLVLVSAASRLQQQPVVQGLEFHDVSSVWELAPLIGSGRRRVSTRAAGARTAPRRRHRAPPSEAGHFAVVLAAAHVAVAVEPGDGGAIAQRHRHLARLAPPGSGNPRSPRSSCVDALPAQRRHRDTGVPARGRRRCGSAGCARCSTGRASILFSASIIGVPSPSSIAPSSRSTSSTSARWRSRVGMGDVADMHDQVGLDHLFQGGAEGGDQMGRQVGDEADRVGDHAVACRPAA